MGKGGGGGGLDLGLRNVVDEEEQRHKAGNRYHQMGSNGHLCIFIN